MEKIFKSSMKIILVFAVILALQAIKPLSVSASKVCSNGCCFEVVCSQNSVCGTSQFFRSQTCRENSIYQDYLTYTCHNPGTAQASCSSSTDSQFVQTCSPNQKCSGHTGLFNSTAYCAINPPDNQTNNNANSNSNGNGVDSGTNCTYHSY